MIFIFVILETDVRRKLDPILKWQYEEILHVVWLESSGKVSKTHFPEYDLNISN